MKTLLTVLTISHVLAGVLALFTGLIPMFAAKGGRLHNRAGLVYVWCMITVAVTALLLCGLQPFKMLRLFLTGIAVLSGYLCLTGWRATSQKRGVYTAFDRNLTRIALLTSVAMLAFGGYSLVRNGPAFYPIVFLFFGFLLGAAARRDWWLQRHPNEPMHWFFQHLTRMGGSYIATFTASLVLNAHRLTPPGTENWLTTVLWIAPSLLGGLLIGKTVARYKRKFAANVPVPV